MSIPVKTLELLAQCVENRSIECFYYRIYLSKHGFIIDGRYVDKFNSLQKFFSITYTAISCMDDNMIEQTITKHINTIEAEFMKVKVTK